MWDDCEAASDDRAQTGPDWLTDSITNSFVAGHRAADIAIAIARRDNNDMDDLEIE